MTPTMHDPKNRESRRKCFKCGKSPLLDDVKLYRFPKPAMKNSLRCLLWAKYMFPDDKLKYSSSVFQNKLHTEHRMLCENHFADTDFVDSTRRKFISKTVVPSCTETVATSKDVVQDSNVDHCYTNKKEPPPSQPILFNQRSNVDVATAVNTSTNTQATNVSGVPQSQTTEINEADDIASADQIDEDPGPVFSWQAPFQLSVEDEDCAEVPSVVTTNDKNLPKREDGTDLTKKDSEDPIEIDGLEDVDKVAKEDTMSMVNEEEVEYKSEKHIGYSCDHCMGEIIGFRYTCVQCENYDLCRACESRLVHPQHYVLRLPAPTPYNKVKSMIEAIRERIKILTEEIKETTDSLVLDDIKEETPFEEVQVDPFEELETIDTVPDIPTEGTDISRVSKGRDAEGRQQGKSAEAERMLKEWDLESETTDIATSEYLESIDNTTKESRKRKLGTIEESGDRQTLDLEEMCQQYFDSTWRDEMDLTTPDDIRRVENIEIEWLDESILDTDNQYTNDDPKEIETENEVADDESSMESGDSKQNQNDNLKKKRQKYETIIKSNKVENNQNDVDKVRGQQKLQSTEQVVRKSQRKVAQKTKVDPEECLLKNLIQSDRKRFNILSKSRKINRLNS